MSSSLFCKYEHLCRIFREFGEAAVAFSGGVDSTLLAKAAVDALGGKAMALHLATCLQPDSERERARALAREIGIRLEEIEADPLAWPEFVANPPDRCYHCKKKLYQLLLARCRSRGIPYLADGTNTDDLLTDRPGLRALRENNIPTPLAAAGLSKREIRLLSRDLGLSSWKFFSASCLATRISSGISIARPQLETVARAEQFLHDLGFEGCRVRLFPDRTAVVEICRGDFGRLTDTVRNDILKHAFSLGMKRIYLDLTERSDLDL